MSPDIEFVETFLSSDLAQFRAWKTADGTSPQGRFLAGAREHRTRIFRAGNRAGKTTVGAVDTLLHVLGWHPRQAFPPPLKWWVSGLSWEVVGEILWPKIKGFLPEDQVAEIAWIRKGEPSIPRAIRFVNGSEIRFKSADAGREKYQGADLHGVWIDEEHPGEVVEECRARLMDYGGYLTCTLTPLARRAWVSELEAEPETLVIRASMIEAAQAGMLDMGAVERFSRALPERQRRVRVFGELVARQGQVYGDFSRARHTARVRQGALYVGSTRIAPWPIPPGWKRWASADFGYANPSAFPICAECPFSGRVIVERLFYANEIRASRWAEILREKLPPLRVPLVCDHDANARAELEDGGIPTIPAIKDVDAGLECVERFLVNAAGDGVPMLVLALSDEHDEGLGRVDAERLAWEFENYRYPEAKDGRPAPKDAPIKANDHALDALRYLLVEYERSSGGPPLPPGHKAKSRDPDTFDPRRALFVEEPRDRLGGFMPRMTR